MSNSVKKTRRQLAISIVIVVLITAVIVGVILILGSGKETKTVTSVESDVEKTIVCTNSDDETSFFKSGYPNSAKHEVRIIVKNNKMDKLSMKYTGVYESEYVAEKSSGIIHAAYNDLLGKNSISQGVFSPNFMKNGSTLTIELIGEVKDINPVTAKLFYIDQSEFNKIKSFSLDGIKRTYENKGFSCDIMN